MITHIAREREEVALPIAEFMHAGELDINPAVEGRGYFELRLKGRTLSLRAGKFVGLVPLNARVTIDVRPKMPVANFVGLIARAGGDVRPIEALKLGYFITEGAPDSVVQALAFAFTLALQRIETLGLAKEYRLTRAGESNIKGRVDFASSIQEYWSRGITYRAVCDYYELTADTDANRVLRLACHAIALQLGALERSSPLLRELNHFNDFLAASGVQLVRGLPAVSRVLSAADSYGQALNLASALLLGQGVTLPAGGEDLYLPSLVIDLETLFERYVRTAIQRRAGVLMVEDGNESGGKPLFDDSAVPTASPDIVVSRDGKHVMVADAKYKDDVTRDDLNQVITYAATYRVDHVLVIMPARIASESGLGYRGRVDRISVHTYRFSLDASDLDQEEAKLVESVTLLCSPQG